jgi:hypothetical protein
VDTDIKSRTVAGGSPFSVRRADRRHAPTAMARLESGEHKRRIHSEAGRALLTASRVGSGAAGDDAQYLAAAGYEPAEINMALGMLEEARAVYMRLSVTASPALSPTQNRKPLQVEELEAIAIERELETMVRCEAF